MESFHEVGAVLWILILFLPILIPVVRFIVNKIRELLDVIIFRAEIEHLLRCTDESSVNKLLTDYSKIAKETQDLNDLLKCRLKSVSEQLSRIKELPK